MSTIDGAGNLAALWEKLRHASDQRERMGLIADAICAASRLEMAVHEARRTAVRVLAHGDKASPDTLERVLRWQKDYR